MECPKCHTKIKNPISVAGGKKGGKAKVKKGFASSSVLEKALKTRRENRLARREKQISKIEEKRHLALMENALGWGSVRVIPKQK